ncbi:MAG TPA: hypothetical protein VGM18_13830 [Candidatus Sulfotelmatobacter sp.]|jgi:hypothetical protein
MGVSAGTGTTEPELTGDETSGGFSSGTLAPREFAEAGLTPRFGRPVILGMEELVLAGSAAGAGCRAESWAAYMTANVCEL